MSERTPNMIHCAKCDNEWGGMNTSHCAGCHTTYSGLTAFDKHRVGGRCATPAEAGLVQSSRAYPCFSFPADPDAGEWWADRAS
jgi:hypothetical protein